MSHSAPGKVELAVVVEDDPQVAFMAGEMLSDLGYTVQKADNADAAAVLLGRSQVALLFTDINMPGNLNGLQFAWAVYELFPRTQILIASGRHSLGASDIPPGARFLNKPFGEAEIKAALAPA